MTGEGCDALGSPFESLDLWNILIPLSGNAAGSRRSCGRDRTIIANPVPRRWGRKTLQGAKIAIKVKFAFDGIGDGP
jgi:hypothetical protein